MRLASLFLSAAFFLAACSVGPDYKGPPLLPGEKKPFARADSQAGASHHAVVMWWKTLNDPLLDDLIMRARKANPDVNTAIARIRQGRAETRLQSANFFPDMSSNTSYARARFPSGRNAGPASNVEAYFQGFDASWEIDIFGEKRRALEAAKANRQSAEAGLDEVYVTLSAEVARTYTTFRDQQQRRILYAQAIASLEQTLALTRQRYQRGTASVADVSRLDAQMQQTKAEEQALAAEYEASLDKMAILIGVRPGVIDAEFDQPAPIPLAPIQLAVDDPETVLQHRPDIRQAERRLAAQTAKIGQAQAARFPKVKFSGLIGTGGTKPSDLTQFDDFTAFLAPQISWDFLDFGRNAARVQSAKGARDEALAKYKKTVLTALQETEDSLSRFKNDRVRVAMLVRSENDAAVAVDLTRQRYQRGTATLIDLLDTERQAITAKQALSQAIAALTVDYIALHKAMGVGVSDRIL